MKKLKNEQGVTILMALLLVLTAAVVSAVILSAALSAARRVNGDRTAQQNYLAVSSAAELVRDSIDQMQYTETTKMTYKWDEEIKGYVESERSTTYSLKDARELYSERTSMMSAWLLDGARNGGCTDTITITLSDEALPPVKASFSMTERGEGNGGYDIQIAFSLVDAGDADDCRMTLRLSGIVGETSDKDTVTQDERYELTITWGNPKITKGVEGNA